MSTLLARKTAQLGDLLLNVTDDEGVDWGADTIDGWQGGYDVASAAVLVSQGDGAYDGPAYAGPKSMTLTGWLHAPNEASRDDAVYRLLAALPMRSMVALQLNEFPPKQCMVRRGGAPLVDNIGDRTAQFSLALFAPDPRLYSVEQTTVSCGLPMAGGGWLVPPGTVPFTLAPSGGGSVVFTNDGTAPTAPLVTLYGPLDHPIVTHGPSGAVLPLNVVTGVSDVLTLDLKSQSVLLNGSDRDGALDDRHTWFTCGSGDNEITFSHAGVYNAQAQMVVTGRSAWI